MPRSPPAVPTKSTSPRPDLGAHPRRTPGRRTPRGCGDVGLRPLGRHRRQGLRRRHRPDHPPRRRRTEEAGRGLRHHAGRQGPLARPVRRQGGRAQRLGFVVPAVPEGGRHPGRRVPRARQGRRRLRGRQHQGLEPRAGARLRASLRRPLRLLLRPLGPDPARLPRDAEPECHPEHGRARPPGPGGRQHPRWGAEPAHAGRPGAGRGGMTPQDLGDWFASTAYSGSLLLAVPVAMVAGLVSFFSPCVVPLLPGYLSYATGLSGADLADARRGRMLTGSLLFVLGFSFVFVSYGALIGAVGEWLFRYERPITIALGVLTILLGLVFLGVVPWMQRDWRIHQVPAVGLAAAPLLGILFGLGWAPCIGPTLTAVTALALNEGSAARGALLSFVYCLGLGLPFIIAALAYRRMLGTIGWVRRHQQWVTAI